MARLLFGGSSDDYAADALGRPITGRRVRFYTSAARTTEITDLASDAAGTGAPLTVNTDSHGFWGPVYGPDAVTVMYAGTVDADGNSPTYVVAVYTHTQTGGGAGVASFNTRTGAVALSKADVTSTGLAAADVGADTSGAAATVQTNLTAEVTRAQAAEAALGGGMQFRTAVVVASTNQALTGLPTVDGVTLTAGQVILLTGQSSGSQNGLWAVASGAWARPANFAVGADATATSVLVESGTAGAGTTYAVTGTSSNVVGTNVLTFVKTSGSAASTASVTPLSKLVTAATKSAVNVALNPPTPGNSTTVFTATGAGMIRNLWVTLEGGTLNKDARLQVFVDGEVAPSIDADFATLFLTGLGASSSTGGPQSTPHMLAMPYGSGRSGAMSGGILFPIPYGNGVTVKVYAPTGSTYSGSGGSLYTQVVYQPGATSTYRLRSAAVTQLNAVTAATATPIVLTDLKNVKGSLVWLSFAGNGAGSYMERQWYVAVDGESLTFDGFNVPNASFLSSGGEDLFLTGWFFGGKSQFSTANAMLTVNASGDTVAGFDFLQAYGGVAFSNEAKVGWAGKEQIASVAAVTFSWCLLYYVDTATAFVPDRPTGVSGAAGNAQAVVSWTAPASSGSSGLTTYTVTATPGGATQSTSAANTSLTFTGLTNNTAYTFTVHANNAVGASAESVASGPVTPNAGSVPGAPTSPSATPGNAQATVTFTAPASNGGSVITGYTATSTPGGLTGSVTGASAAPITVSGLTNGTAYTFTVHATNANGNGSESVSSNSVTPTGSTPTLPTVSTGTLVGRWRASDLALSDGAAVGTWTDTYGGGSTHNLTQATGANQPTYKTSIVNGRAIVRFSGTNWMDSGAFAQSQPFTVFYVARPTSTASRQQVFGNGASFQSGINTSGSWVYYGGGGDSGLITATANTWAALTVYGNGASSNVYLNGSPGTAVSNSASYGSFTVGANPAGAQPFTGDIAEVVIFSGALNATDRHAVENYLGQYYSISMTLG